MARQSSRDVSLALSEADAALTVLDRVLADPVPDDDRALDTLKGRAEAALTMIAKARAALDRAQDALAEVGLSMQRGLDRL